MSLSALFDHPPTAFEQPYVIAEAGVNHEGSMETARRLIEEAAEAGADAIKFQTYRAETLASRNSPAYWDTTKEPTTSQYELFKRHDSFWKTEFEELRRHCEATGIEFLSTPFDVESATFLNDLMAAFKISSSDLTNLPFIRYICSFDKPVLLSTGASYLWEIAEAVQVIEDAGNRFSLMHCILNYPAEDAAANLGMLKDLTRRFPEALLGYSDHTLPNPAMDVLTTATMLGARILEKHFTHDKALSGNDHYHAMDQQDLRSFRIAVDRILLLVGSSSKRPLESEEISRRNARRSLVAARRITAGSTLTVDDLTWKRPATGISPREIDRVIGRPARADIQQDTVLTWNLLD